MNSVASPICPHPSVIQSLRQISEFNRRLSLPAPRAAAPPIAPQYSPDASQRVEVTMLFPDTSPREIFEAWVNFDLLPAFMRGTPGRASERFEAPWFLQLKDGEQRWLARTTQHITNERIGWEGVDSTAGRHHGCVSFSRTNRRAVMVRVEVQFETDASASVTPQTVKRTEAKLRDVMEMLRTLLGPGALPPMLAGL